MSRHRLQSALLSALLLLATWSSNAWPQPGSRLLRPAGQSSSLVHRGAGSRVSTWSARAATAELPSSPGPGVSSAAPAGISDGAGGSIVLLRDWSHGVETIRLQRVDAAGAPQWGSRGVLLTAAGSDAVRPAMATDLAGGAVIAWAGAVSNSGTSGLFVQRVSAEGVEQWVPGGIQLTGNAAAGRANPVLTPVFGGAIVAWVESGPSYSPDIFAQRVDASGVVRWTPGGVAVCTAYGDQLEPAIVPCGTAGAIVAWTDARFGPQHDLYAQRLNASGVTQWSWDGVIVCNDVSDQEAPALVADGANGAIVTWCDARFGTYDLFAEHLDSGGGQLWGGGQPVCVATGTQRNPQAISDNAGGAVVVWEDLRSGNMDVFAQRVLSVGDTSWAPAVPLCTAAGDQWAIALASDGGSGAIVAWVDYRNGYLADIYAQRLSGGGAPLWGANGLAVCADALGPELAAVVADGGGGAVVAWNELRSFDPELYGQRLDASGAAQWASTGAGLILDPGVQHDPVQVPDGAGGTIVAWQQKMGGVYKVCVRGYDAAGLPKWPQVRACTAQGLEVLPSLAADGAGGAFVAWVDGRAGLEEADIYVQRISATGSRVWADGGVALCESPGLQFVPAIVGDGAGGAIVAWLSDAFGGDVYARRVDGSGVPQWAPGGVQLCTAGSEEFPDSFGRDVIVSDGAGGAIVVWDDQRNGTDADVYVQRIDAGGATLFGSAGIPLCTAGGDQRNVVVTTDGAGGAIVIWEDYRAWPAGIYAQRVLPSGARPWTTDGILLSGSTYNAYFPQIISDGAGGAILAWTEYGSPSTSPDIFALRINASGTPLWSPRDGRALCLASGAQREPVLASDGANGAIVAWLDFRDGVGLTDVDLYAQRILSSGTTFWPYNGVALCGYPDVQVEPALIPDGSHGLIAAWQDHRSDDRDYIYLQRLGATGASLWSPDPTVDVAPRDGAAPLDLAISSVLPNPVASRMTVSFSVPREGAAVLELFDVGGRRLFSHPLGSRAAGPHAISLEVPRGLSPGVYLLRLEHEGRSQSRKVCVLR